MTRNLTQKLIEARLMEEPVPGTPIAVDRPGPHQDATGTLVTLALEAIGFGAVATRRLSSRRRVANQLRDGSRHGFPTVATRVSCYTPPQMRHRRLRNSSHPTTHSDSGAPGNPRIIS